MGSPRTTLEAFCDEVTFQKNPKTWKSAFQEFTLAISTKLGAIDAQAMTGYFPTIGLADSVGVEAPPCNVQDHIMFG